MNVVVLVPRNIAVKKVAEQRVANAKEKGLCVACLKKIDGRVIRGCCTGCYQATIRAIHRGDFTEEERMRNGKLLEKSSGRPPSNPVSQEARG